MAIQNINHFIRDVVRDHELASGLKPLMSHRQIISYGNNKGFEFTESEWITVYESDFARQSDAVQQSILAANTAHWSWAFRQLSVWRGMLMGGAGDGSA